MLKWNQVDGPGTVAAEDGIWVVKEARLALRLGTGSAVRG